jgi:hypothetical protein
VCRRAEIEELIRHDPILQGSEDVPTNHRYQCRRTIDKRQRRGSPRAARFRRGFIRSAKATSFSR